MYRSAENNARDAVRWVSDNPEAWGYLLKTVKWLNDHGRPVMRDSIYTRAAESGVPITVNDQFMRDHNMWAVLARYMVMLDPSLLRCVRLRKSALDEIDLASIWRERMDAPLAAESVKEASEVANEQLED